MSNVMINNAVEDTISPQTLYEEPAWMGDHWATISWAGTRGTDQLCWGTWHWSAVATRFTSSGQLLLQHLLHLVSCYNTCYFCSDVTTPVTSGQLLWTNATSIVTLVFSAVGTTDTSEQVVEQNAWPLCHLFEQIGLLSEQLTLWVSCCHFWLAACTTDTFGSAVWISVTFDQLLELLSFLWSAAWTRVSFDQLFKHVSRLMPHLTPLSSSLNMWSILVPVSCHLLLYGLGTTLLLMFSCVNWRSFLSFRSVFPMH
jgi:hypothetical protein